MRSRGFTLIEVLVALVVVALGMSAVLASLTSAADTVYFLKDKTLAEWIAFNRITEVRLQKKLPVKGKTDGDVEFAGRNGGDRGAVGGRTCRGRFRGIIRRSGSSCGGFGTNEAVRRYHAARCPSRRARAPRGR